MKTSKFKGILKKIRALEDTYRALSDEELAGKTVEFKERISHGEKLDRLLVEAFAVCIEADERILGKRPYDVQILGAIGLHKGYLVEMNTGEGKTLTATMPLYLNALSGKSSMLVTANGYLAYRDAEEMGPVYEFLGLTVRAGVSENEKDQLTSDQKREIYAADIVYTTHGTLGFDYLFNNLVSRKEERFLCEFNYVIIDEADMVLLDAAQMPLVISGSPRVQSNLYEMTDFFVTTLKEDEDYEVEDKMIWLTKKGVAYAEKFFNIKKFYSKDNFELNRHITLALRAHGVMVRGEDYLVSDENEIVLMDNGSGRSAPGMKLRGGQHQAIEQKEKVEVSQDTRSVASVTYQNFFMLFPKLSGMSGTIADAKRELWRVYKKRVLVIPPNRKLQRKDQKDIFFINEQQQLEAALNDVVERHEKGQPVLVVTSTIEDTEEMSRALIDRHVTHNVLNANNAYWEAQIIKEAGQKDAVTVSTGMAGRGTDIRLGEGVAELGGLAIIAVGRMSNIRLERQIRGRAGRQGDPGVSQFYVSLEDGVVSDFLGEEKAEKLLRKKHMTRHRLKRIINGARKFNEDNGFSSREQAVDYDKVMKYQRDVFYDSRNRLLDGGSLECTLLRKIAKSNVKRFVKTTKKLDRAKVHRYILDNLTYMLETENPLLGCLKKRHLRKRKVKRALIRYTRELIDERIESFDDEERLKEFIRLCALHTMDDAWVEEVDYVQQLQYVISGRQSAQRNPVYEYQQEAYSAFLRMQIDVKRDLLRNFLLGEPQLDAEGNMKILFP